MRKTITIQVKGWQAWLTTIALVLGLASQIWAWSSRWSGIENRLSATELRIEPLEKGTAFAALEQHKKEYQADRLSHEKQHREDQKELNVNLKLLTKEVAEVKGAIRGWEGY